MRKGKGVLCIFARTRTICHQLWSRGDFMQFLLPGLWSGFPPGALGADSRPAGEFHDARLAISERQNPSGVSSTQAPSRGSSKALNGKNAQRFPPPAASFAHHSAENLTHICPLPYRVAMAPTGLRFLAGNQNQVPKFLFQTKSKPYFLTLYRSTWKPTRSPLWRTTPALPSWGVHWGRGRHTGRGTKVLTSGGRRTEAAAAPIGAPQAPPGAQPQVPPGDLHLPHGAVAWAQKTRPQAVVDAIFAHWIMLSYFMESYLSRSIFWNLISRFCKLFLYNKMINFQCLCQCQYDNKDFFSNYVVSWPEWLLPWSLLNRAIPKWCLTIVLEIKIRTDKAFFVAD